MGAVPDKYSNYYNLNEFSWSVVEALPDALLILDSKSTIIYINSAAEPLLNLTFPSALGRKLARTCRDYTDSICSRISSVV